jgi:hypothetical protein
MIFHDYDAFLSMKILYAIPFFPLPYPVRDLPNSVFFPCREVPSWLFMHEMPESRAEIPQQAIQEKNLMNGKHSMPWMKENHELFHSG